MAQLDCSIIIPAFNAEEHITECLRSIVNHKTGHRYEIIVVDDGSKDATSAIVSTQFSQVRLFQKKNGGPGSARNHGVKQALADILVFIDADDRMLDGRLDHQVGYMLAHPDVTLTFGNQWYERSPDMDFNRECKWADSDEFTVVENAFARLMVLGSTVANTATAVRKHAYVEIGGQPEAYFVGEDYAMCCAIAKRWPIAASCRYLTWYRQADHGNLMASSHTYVGPPQVLLDNLRESSNLLTPEELGIALSRLQKLVGMLVKYKWAYSGRDQVVQTLGQYGCMLPKRFVFKLKVLTKLPSFIPRTLRLIRHRGRLPHAHG